MKKPVSLRLTKLFELHSHDGADVDERNFFLYCNGVGPASIAADTYLDLRIFPDVTRCQRHDDRRCAPSDGVPHIFADIPPVCVHNLVFVRNQIIDLLRFGACAGKGAAGPCIVIDRKNIILPELN